MKKFNFGQLEIKKEIAKALVDMGFEEPTPIQAEAIPLIMENSDVIGQAQTGTGKTAAFGIPIIEKINPQLPKVQALILTPTRELAMQVAGEISKIGRYKKIKVLPIYGGQPIDRQIRSLRMGVNVVIGTPGRTLDHLKRKTLDLSNVKTAVLDEADEMLDMGFIEDIEDILSNAPKERQTLLFSATMPAPIQKLSKKYLQNPHFISVNKETLTVPLIEQFYYEIVRGSKVDALCRILDYENYDSVIIFCRTKRGVDELVANLQTRGYFAEGLHGDLTQVQRDKTMKAFRQGDVELLVATDVAARGLDIERVSHVFNYDIPLDPEAYVHRIGRTGRAGKEGKALTLILPQEYRHLRMIEKLIKTKITKAPVPTFQEVVEQQKGVIRKTIEDILTEGNLQTYQSITQDLMQNFAAEDIVAAALKYAFTQRDAELSEIDFSGGFGNTGAQKGMVRLFITMGRQQNILPRDLVKIIFEETGVSPKVVGEINIFDKFSFVEIPEEMGYRVIYIMDRLIIKGKKISVQLARPRS
ncbi:MAG: DEAD/DEAH box helicase [Clostridia bacterium]|nr:DEAD/DEAH box helicase [Clostridia bacterium]MDD4665858.1 DEAD/DEAH box helicase [Clostridia bacterium]